MNRRISCICTIAGNRIDGGVGQPTMPLASQTATAMQSPVLVVNKALVVNAANEVLKPTLTATEAVKEVARRLQVFGKALPGTPIYMNNCRRQSIALINSAELTPRYKYFLTYGANDMYWPEIPEMVGHLKARNEKAGSVDVDASAPAVEAGSQEVAASVVPTIYDSKAPELTDMSDEKGDYEDDDVDHDDDHDDDVGGLPRPRSVILNPCDVSDASF